MRDCSRINDLCWNIGLPRTPNKTRKIFASERKQFSDGRFAGQFRIAFAANIAGEGQMTGRARFGKQRRGKNCAEDFESFYARNEHAKALARMRDILALKTKHNACDWRIADFGKRFQRDGLRGFDR